MESWQSEVALGPGEGCQGKGTPSPEGRGRQGREGITGKAWVETGKCQLWPALLWACRDRPVGGGQPRSWC